jgi:hypothetical protein
LPSAVNFDLKFWRIKGAFFADAGNIWNVYDNVTDEKSTLMVLKV